MLKQYVSIDVWDQPEGGNRVFFADGLRIDFDVRLIPEFNRATFTIYNMNNAQITSLMDGDRYVTLKTRLHDGRIYTIANKFYVNNATDQVIAPDRITKLFCQDKLRKLYSEQQVDLEIKYPSLSNMIDQVLDSTGHEGARVFTSFPIGLVDELGKAPSRPQHGNVQQCLRRLGNEFNFETYTYEGGYYFMYKPDISNVASTDLATRAPDVMLQTQAMRANPKIGIANATINSNLDPRIRPTSLIDISQLFTIEADADESTLQLANNFLKNFSNYNKYQSFAVQHKGSNYTAEWSTIINALSPTSGKLMKTVAWGGQ
tara:strand:+ start:3912 stop:4862 length:951 start_codon:yes stop_codon:yes gene_type:complete